jgi:hypothetical protein
MGLGTQIRLSRLFSHPSGRLSVSLLTTSSDMATFVPEDCAIFRKHLTV